MPTMQLSVENAMLHQTKPRIERFRLRAAAQLAYRDAHVPPQNLGGMAQLARNLKREAEAAAALRI